MSPSSRRYLCSYYYVYSRLKLLNSVFRRFFMQITPSSKVSSAKNWQCFSFRQQNFINSFKLTTIQNQSKSIARYIPFLSSCVLASKIATQQQLCKMYSWTMKVQYFILWFTYIRALFQKTKSWKIYRWGNQSLCGTNQLAYDISFYI